MKSVIRWAIGHSAAMNTLLIAVMLLGVASLATMRREVFPEFKLEILLVSVPYPGARPEEVEQGICQKIEEAVQSIDGIKKQTAVAQENAGFAVLELEAGVDVQRVLNEVRSEIDQIPSFPELAEDPDVQQITLRSPAIRVGVLGPDRDDEDAQWALREIAEQVRNDLLQLQPMPPRDLIGMALAKIRATPPRSVVSSANILGAQPYQIDIEISEQTLRRYGLTLRRVAQIVRRQNLELPGGRIKTNAQEMLLVGKNKRTLGSQIEQIVVLTQPDGDQRTIGDLGHVRDGFVDDTMITRVNGRPALVIQVDRTSAEDLYQLVSNVRHYAQTKRMPPGYELKLWFDHSVDVRERMEMLIRNGRNGLILVFLVLAVFLDLRLAFWVALGIPVAILGAGAFLLYAGHTLNMLTMFAFVMALGIVVDDAIVIGENAYHHRHLGKGLLQAAVDGTYEVLPSVAASVTTTIIAFVPLLFVAGVMGKFIAVMAVAVIAMLVISLIESALILPCHLAHHENLFFRILGVVFYPLKFLLRLSHGLNQRAAHALERFVQRAYLPALRWSLANPAIVLSAAAALLLLAAGFVKAGITPFVVFPKLDSRFVEAVVTYPNGTPAEVTDRATRRLEQAIQRIDAAYRREMQAQHGGRSKQEMRDEDRGKLIRIRHRMVGQISQPSSRNPTGTTTGSHLGAVMVELVPPSQRNITSQQVLDAWRQQAGRVPGAESVLFRSPRLGPGGAPIEFKLLADPGAEDQLEPAAELCKAKLARYRGLYDIDDDSRPGKWELRLKVKETAKAMGVTLADLAETVRDSYYGEEVMRLQRGRHEVKLMVRYPPDERRTLAGFEQIRVRGADLAERPVMEVADVSYQRGTSEINRIDQLRSITITADVDEAHQNAYNVVQQLKKEFIPRLKQKFPGIRVRWEGQQEQTQESMHSLEVGLGVALLGMFVLLTFQFRSYVQPLLILSIIPFGAIGAIGGHALLGMDLTLFSVFGLVALSGVVVNDSIVLLDFINTRVRAGLPLRQALSDAGRRRFRAVLLTSVTTIAGLLPLLLERSFQAQVLIPMATSLCFGLMLATALVLILVPTFYLTYARLTARLGGRPLEEREKPAPPEIPQPSQHPLPAELLPGS